MDKLNATEPHQRLANARSEAGYRTASEAARAFGWNENTYRSHENGERGIKKGIASVYARAFKTTAGYIMFGHEGVFWRSRVLVTGKVFNNGEVILSGGKNLNQTTDTAQLAIMFNDEVVGFEVDHAANLLAFQPGDLIITWAWPWDKLRAANRYGVVQLADGSWLLRFLRHGDNKNSYNLEFPFKPTLTSVEPITVLPVHAIVPRDEWRREDPTTRQPRPD